MRRARLKRRVAHRPRRPVRPLGDRGRQHADLAARERERQLLQVGLEHDPRAVGRQRRVGREVARLAGELAGVRRRRAVVAHLREPARKLAELAAQQDLAPGARSSRRSWCRSARARAGRSAASAWIRDGERPCSRPISSGLCSPRRSWRNAASVTPKISGASLGIANWCSEWKNRCCERWPCVSVRSARLRSVASTAGVTSPARGATSCVASFAGSGHPCGGRELREVVAIVAQLAPDLAARHPEQRVQATLVVRQPVVVDPVLWRQPVRGRLGRSLGVQRGLLDGRCGLRDRRRAAATPARARRRAAASAAMPAPASPHASRPRADPVPTRRRYQ